MMASNNQDANSKVDFFPPRTSPTQEKIDTVCVSSS